MAMQIEKILPFVKRKLEEEKGRWPELSRVTGVPYFTLAKISSGAVTNPQIETLQPLLDHFNFGHAADSGTPEAA